jgi:hypothetical protein
MADGRRRRGVAGLRPTGHCRARQDQGRQRTASMPAPTSRCSDPATGSAATPNTAVTVRSRAVRQTNSRRLWTVDSLKQHPGVEIITSIPGFGSLTGAQVLTAIDDGRTRFTDPRALRAYAGSAPTTRASGKSIAVMARRNQKPAAGRSRLRLTLLRPHRLTRRQSALRRPGQQVLSPR